MFRAYMCGSDDEDDDDEDDDVCIKRIITTLDNLVTDYNTFVVSDILGNMSNLSMSSSPRRSPRSPRRSGSARFNQ